MQFSLLVKYFNVECIVLSSNVATEMDILVIKVPHDKKEQPEKKGIGTQAQFGRQWGSKKR